MATNSKTEYSMAKESMVTIYSVSFNVSLILCHAIPLFILLSENIICNLYGIQWFFLMFFYHP